MIKRYNKKPETIEALQFTGDNYDEAKDFCPTLFDLPSEGLRIPTIDGLVKVSTGDFILKFTDNFYSACNQDIFKLHYEQRIEDKIQGI